MIGVVIDGQFRINECRRGKPHFLSASICEKFRIYHDIYNKRFNSLYWRKLLAVFSCIYSIIIIIFHGIWHDDY